MNTQAEIRPFKNLFGQTMYRVYWFSRGKEHWLLRAVRTKDAARRQKKNVDIDILNGVA